MKIAIPIWGNRISPVFDAASRLLVVDVSDNREPVRSETELQMQDLSRRCIRIQDLGVDILICGAITGHFMRLLKAAGIDVISGISGNTEEILGAYLQGRLSQPRFLMPGCKALKRKHPYEIFELSGTDRFRKSI